MCNLPDDDPEESAGWRDLTCPTSSESREPIGKVGLAILHNHLPVIGSSFIFHFIAMLSNWIFIYVVD